jgi:hypothetical protein
MDGLEAGGLFIDAHPLVFPQQAADLFVHVHPFAHPLPGKKMGLAEARQPRFGRGFPAGHKKTVPDIEQGEEVGLFIDELAMNLVGLVLLVRRPHARVLDGQGRGPGW